MNIVIKILIIIKSKFLAKDYFGNKYYEEKKFINNKKPKRWVIYKNDSNLATVPVKYQMWLNYVVDDIKIPIDESLSKNIEILNKDTINICENIKTNAKQEQYQFWKP